MFDVSGAGDTAIAVFTLGLVSGASACEAAELANLASGIVVGKLGTATVGAAEIARGKKSFRDILSHYYPATLVESVGE